MDQLFIKRSNIAWFSLAECVLRKEQTKAFKTLKLLTYFIKDQALSLQLEGDLLLSFNESEKALVCYAQALDLYEKHKKNAASERLHKIIISVNALPVIASVPLAECRT